MSWPYRRNQECGFDSLPGSTFVYMENVCLSCFYKSKYIYHLSSHQNIMFVVLILSRQSISQSSPFRRWGGSSCHPETLHLILTSTRESVEDDRRQGGEREQKIRVWHRWTHDGRCEADRRATLSTSCLYHYLLLSASQRDMGSAQDDCGFQISCSATMYETGRPKLCAIHPWT